MIGPLYVTVQGTETLEGGVAVWVDGTYPDDRGLAEAVLDACALHREAGRLASDTGRAVTSDIDYTWLYAPHPEQLDAAHAFYDPMPPDLFMLQVILGSPAPERVVIFFLFDPDYLPLLKALATGPMFWLAHEPIPGTETTPLLLTLRVPPPGLPGDCD